MPDLDAQSLADQAVMLGLVARPDARQAVADAEDGSYDAVARSFLRKGLLTSWQLDRLQKGDPVGFFYGGCKVLFHLAEGTFARVYRGVKVDTGSPVAIKVLRNRFVTDPASIDRFHKEAEAGMKLRHPNIVRIIDYGEEDKRYYMIMEYVEGANLRDLLRLRARFVSEDALPLMLGLARGLKYSIDQGVTHRDIKGTNILISNSGEAKLVDFGLATIETDEKKTTMQSQRTVDYSALERTCGSEKGDPRSDIYFLGCVFYQMLTGQLPLKEVESKDPLKKQLVRSFGAIVPISEHRLAPDPELAYIVERMMKIDLKSRYQTMEQVISDLEKYEERVKHGITGIELSSEGEEDSLGIDFDDIFSTRPGEVGQQVESSSKLASVGKSTADERTVLCVESRAEIQDAFRKSLTKMGYRVILVGDAERAAERYAEAPTGAVVIDVDGLGQEALDALAEMRERASEESLKFSALVIFGPRQRDLQATLPPSDELIVMSKPVKMKQVQASLIKLLPVKKRS